MKYMKKAFMILVILGLLLLSGCDEQISGNMQTNNVQAVEEVQLAADETPQYNSECMTDWDNLKELMFSMGQEIKELDNISDIDRTVITVNKCPITEREIKTKQIGNKSKTQKEIINELIRDKAVLSAALSKNIEPDMNELNSYMERTKQVLNDAEMSSPLKAYCSGRGITVDEYFIELEKIEYKNHQLMKYWETVLPREEIKKEAESRTNSTNGSYIEYQKRYDEVLCEYVEKYTDELVKDAKIKVLDREIKAMEEL